MIPSQHITLKWTMNGNKVMRALQYNTPKLANIVKSQSARYGALCKAS